jgi:hypothetical protein
VKWNWLVLGGMLAAGWAFAQENDALEIRGIVVESGLSSGVAGAEITVYQFSKTSERTVFATGTTDPQGNFQFHPTRAGDYYVEARKPEYFATKGIEGPTQSRTMETGSLVSVSHDHPEVYVRLAMMRIGELKGRVVDEDDKPVEGISVEALDDSGSPGRGGSTQARTNKDGSFRIQNLSPGQYRVRLSARSFNVLPPATKFSAADMNAVGHGVGTSWWPGVRDASAAGKVTIVPGTPVDLDTIRVQKGPLYRVQVSVRGCRPGDELQFSLSGAGSAINEVRPDGTSDRFSLPAVVSRLAGCEDFLVRDLPAGSYEFALQSKQGWAIAPVELDNKNLFVTIAMIPEADVTATVIAAHDGMSLPALDRLRIQLQAPPWFLPIAPSLTARAKFSDGKFWFQGIRGPRHAVTVSGLGSGYYVKEIRSNGVVATDGIITPGPGTNIEVVIDDEAVTLTGAVTDGGKPANQPKIYVSRWPEASRPPVGMDKAPTATGDGEGRFQIAGLPPGEYRVLAVPSGPIPDGDPEWNITPQVWERAERVSLERGKEKEVLLRVTDPLL